MFNTNLVELGIIPLVSGWGECISQRMENDLSLLDDKSLCLILYEHKVAIESAKLDGDFTIFDVISDFYYRENFHSDILAFFLNPLDNHNNGMLGLQLFIKLVNKASGLNIKEADYEAIEVVREFPGEGRIDILIKNSQTKHAILIENKMNNAGDMDRQIPRYCEYLENQGFKIDAAVYLPLTRFKIPDKSSWKKKDLSWDDIIVVIPAIAEKGILNLADDWVKVLSEQSSNPDVSSSLKQYAVLLSKLSTQNMDKISFDKLYDYLMKDDHLDSANSLMAMMNEFPAYLASRIFDSYSKRCYPFSKVCIYSGRDAVFEQCLIDGVYFKMDIWCDSRSYDLIFWAPEDKNDISQLVAYNDIKEFLKDKGISVFDSYNFDNINRISNRVRITTPINTIVEPILEQLRSVCEKQ